VATLSTESLLIDYVSKFVPPLFVFLRSLTIGAPSCMPIYLFIYFSCPSRTQRSGAYGSDRVMRLLWEGGRWAA
jgi:hypothetical protein